MSHIGDFVKANLAKQYATQSSGVLLAGDEAKQVTAFDHVHRALERSINLATRVQALAERLLGPTVNPGSTGAQGVPIGFLNEVGDNALAAFDRVDSAHEALSRIERALA